TVDGWAVAEQGDRRDDHRRADAADLSRRSGRVVSSEHVTEQVPLAEIREGDMLQDPKSGNWKTADGTTSATRRYSDGERTSRSIASTTATEGRRSIPGSLRAS